MGWGEKAIELRSANTGNLEGVFMHKKAQKLKFLCERNDKVGLQLWTSKALRFVAKPVFVVLTSATGFTDVSFILCVSVLCLVKEMDQLEPHSSQAFYLALTVLLNSVACWDCNQSNSTHCVEFYLDFSIQTFSAYWIGLYHVTEAES